MSGLKPAISVKHLSKKYGALEVLKDINIDIYDGQVVSVIGPSGSGKSTFLRCLNYLEQPSGGSIEIYGNTLLGEEGDKGMPKKNEKQARLIRKNVGMVFQQFNLWPHKTVLENIIEGPVQIKKENKDEATKRAMELLKKVGMDSTNVVPKFSVISNVPPTTKENKKQVENPALMGMTLRYKEYAKDKEFMKLMMIHLMNARLVLPATEVKETDITGKKKIQFVTIARKDDPSSVALPVFTDFSTLVSWKEMFAGGRKPTVAVIPFKDAAKYVQNRKCDLVINPFGPVGVGVPNKLIEMVANATKK